MEAERNEVVAEKGVSPQLPFDPEKRVTNGPIIGPKDIGPDFTQPVEVMQMKVGGDENIVVPQALAGERRAQSPTRQR